MQTTSHTSNEIMWQKISESCSLNTKLPVHLCRKDLTYIYLRNHSSEQVISVYTSYWQPARKVFEIGMDKFEQWPKCSSHNVKYSCHLPLFLLWAYFSITYLMYTTNTEILRRWWSPLTFVYVENLCWIRFRTEITEQK